MELADFDYHLPKNLIAQRPIEPRDTSRLMVLEGSRIHHRTFKDLHHYLEPGDILVLNDSKVLPARIFGKKDTGGKVEALLITKVDDNTWECMIKGKNVREDSHLIFGEGDLNGTVIERVEGGRFLIEFEEEQNLAEIFHRIGVMPTPPYIKELLEDQSRYQTVYAREDGSIAAPTAGLHFTEEYLETLRQMGARIITITLHVSVGTFLPVKKKYIKEHKMEPEFFKIDSKTAEEINNAKSQGSRIFAVGTTTMKALESACDEEGNLSEFQGESNLFIYPGYRFKTGLFGLLTNFHLPKSTLIMLVSAFAGKDTIFKAYSEAISQEYRFYSFGDAMLILK
jgi:S-adenosylmethionine:tRNA ribosyltransferase-isomerase